MNFSQKVTARNIFRYKKRAIITIIGIAGCTGLMLTGFGIRDSVQDIPNFQYKEIYQYDSAISLLNTNGMKEIEECLTKQEEIESYQEVYVGTGRIANEDRSYDVSIYVPNQIEEFYQVAKLIDVNTKEELKISDNGVILTEKVADAFGIKVGEEITITDAEEVKHVVKVEGITKHYVGHCVYMSKNYYETNLLSSYQTNMLLVKAKEMSEETQNQLSENLLQIEGVASVLLMPNIMQSISDMLSTMDYVVIVLIITSAMLAFVVLYNLANINIGERKREIATLKVLGFQDKEVDSYINKETIIFTLIGVILGLVFGVFLTNIIIGTIEIDLLKFDIKILPTSYLLSAMITIGFSVIVNNIIHFVLKKIDMIESLKSVE